MNRVPEPALIRSAIVSVTAVVAVIIGHTVDIGWLDDFVNTYAGVAPLIAGFIIRRVVTPVKAHEHAAPAPARAPENPAG